MSKMNPYIKHKPITARYIRDRINQGGCYCVREYILKYIEESNLRKSTKARLWELVQDKKDWGSC